jgi:dTDP-4-amino-4,6-dideoxygalactose transaminase
MYRELLADSGVDVPIEPEGYESCYHLFVIRTPGRDVIREALTRAGIESGVHYPVPLHMQPACAQLGYRPGDFPNAERLAATALSLPMHPHLSDEQVVQIAAVVREAAKEARAAA